jgi:hypothetical protein
MALIEEINYNITVCFYTYSASHRPQHNRHPQDTHSRTTDRLPFQQFILLILPTLTTEHTNFPRLIHHLNLTSLNLRSKKGPPQSITHNQRLLLTKIYHHAQPKQLQENKYTTTYRYQYHSAATGCLPNHPTYGTRPHDAQPAPPSPWPRKASDTP